MQNIIRLFTKYGSHIVFILLQSVCYYLIVQFNQNQRSIFLNSSSLYVGKLTEKLGSWDRYLSLDEVNDSLALHNAELLELYINHSENYPTEGDSSLLQYELTPAKVINTSYKLRNNHITIDKGAASGIKRDMGVMSHNGIVGIVRNTSDNFAHIVSILNAQTKISATISPYFYPGTLVWKTSDPQIMDLEAIPKHAEISVGDTVVTSGYSTIFPKGIAIGLVSMFDTDKGSNNYNIKVRLLNDLPNEKVVYVVHNILAEEQLTLESEVDE